MCTYLECVVLCQDMPPESSLTSWLSELLQRNLGCRFFYNCLPENLSRLLIYLSTSAVEGWWIQWGLMAASHCHSWWRWWSDTLWVPPISLWLHSCLLCHFGFAGTDTAVSFKVLFDCSCNFIDISYMRCAVVIDFNLAWWLQHRCWGWDRWREESIRAQLCSNVLCFRSPGKFLEICRFILYLHCCKPFIVLTEIEFNQYISSHHSGF